jgi:hypothetical protein
MECIPFLRARRWYVREFEEHSNSLMATQAILQLRLYALYSLDKRMLAAVIFVFTIALTISGYILVSVLSKTAGALPLSKASQRFAEPR